MSGFIEYENRDKTGDNRQKQRFRAFLKHYENRMHNLAITLNTLDYLTKNNEDFSNLSTISPAFMRSVINNFWAQAIITLDAFYYHKNRYSFENFFNYTQSNWNLIFTGQFYQTIHQNSSSKTSQVKFSKQTILNTIKDCRKIVENHQAEIGKLRTLRNNVFAHFGELEESISISVDDLLFAFKFTGEIINKLEVFYDRTITWYDSPFSQDVQKLCHVIAFYKKHCTQIQVEKNSHPPQKSNEQKEVLL